MSLGWPFDARQKSYTANTTRIAAVDLNAIQDQIIALSRGRSRATANWGVGAFTAAPGATRIGEFYVSAAAGATTPAMKLGVATGYGAPTVELLSGVNTADSFISPGYDTATGLFYYQTWLDHTMTADIALTAIGANNASAYIGTVAAPRMRQCSTSASPTYPLLKSIASPPAISRHRVTLFAQVRLKLLNSLIHPASTPAPANAVSGRICSNAAPLVRYVPA